MQNMGIFSLLCRVKNRIIENTVKLSDLNGTVKIAYPTLYQIFGTAIYHFEDYLNNELLSEDLNFLWW